MSLSDLTTFSDPAISASGTSSGSRRGFPAWALPAVLLAGFAAVFLLLFGKRLLPAQPVSVAPVITLRMQTEEKVRETESTPPVTGTKATAKGPLLFQASGWVEPDPYIIDVPALVNGIVETVDVLEGESVKKGQILATLVDEEAQLDYEEATQAVSTLEKQIHAHCERIPQIEAKIEGLKKAIRAEEALLQELEDQSKRVSALGRGSISEQQITSAKLQVERQKAMVEKARTQIPEEKAELEVIAVEREAMESRLSETQIKQARAKLALDRHTIRSPMDGIVLHLHVVPGKKRMMNMDDPKSAVIVELFEPQKLQARIDVPLTEASLITIGQPVEMTTDLLPDATLEGTVTRITGQADLQRNTLQVKVALKNPDPRLRPEMLVRGKFFALAAGGREADSDSAAKRSSGRLSLFMPEAALAGSDTAWVVTSEETAERRAIQVGKEKRDGHIKILEGLRSGEKVILPPHNHLQDGLRVRIES
ncbi:MAG: efflux RND transporter periplasmic adaptor subunit [Verrucomicrobiales bacterium]|nr:efflux RND transporter periplasmic adaptor subunit [Verrucomicrobiales bacterium]